MHKMRLRRRRNQVGYRVLNAENRIQNFYDYRLRFKRFLFPDTTLLDYSHDDILLPRTQRKQTRRHGFQGLLFAFRKLGFGNYNALRQ
jgi:hypothetical protein